MIFKVVALRKNLLWQATAEAPGRGSEKTGLIYKGQLAHSKFRDSSQSKMQS